MFCYILELLKVFHFRLLLIRWSLDQKWHTFLPPYALAPLILHLLLGFWHLLTFLKLVPLEGRSFVWAFTYSESSLTSLCLYLPMRLAELLLFL